MNAKTRTATFFALLSAALYAINVPLSKLLLGYAAPSMMAAFLYLGAGIGMLSCGLACKYSGKTKPAELLTVKELPYTVAMIVLDIAAPILLMLGLTMTSSANASLLNNFEIVATSLIAFFVFREVISRHLRIALILVVLSSIILGYEGSGSFLFNKGSLLVLGACICWGIENNCTRKLSSKSSAEIVIIKGIFSGLGSLIVAFICGEPLPQLQWILIILLLGFVSYGLSINFYILAQKDLGAAKTGAYYAAAPFIGVLFSLVILGERPAFQFYIGLAVMLAATVFIIRDTVTLQHDHPHTHTHTHEHLHDGVAHTHEHTHTHTHLHTHGEDESTHTHAHHVLEEHTHTHEEISP